MLDLATYSAALPIVSRINELHQQIEALRPISPAQEQRILQKYRLDWNYHSNAIEGNSLTYGETRAFLMHGLTAKGKPLKDHLDIRGHNKAIDFLYQMIKEESEITETDIRSLHEVILVEPYEVDTRTEEGIPAKKRIQLGKYKTSPNHVLTQTGEIHYYASPEETPILMAELIETYRQNKANSEVHPYVLASYFHYRFTAIHPFDDGNGRMARLMMNLLLMKAGYPPVIIRQEKTSREAYYYALSQADAGEFVPFFELIGEALLHSMELYVKGAKGESLEEPDDLDKELALLKKSLETLNDKIEKVHSIETQLEVFEKSFLPLDEELESLFVKFKEFFIEYDKKSGIETEDKKTQTKKISTIDPVGASYFKNKVDSIYFGYTFSYYINKRTPFCVFWQIRIVFKKLDYSISIQGKSFNKKDANGFEAAQNFSFNEPILIEKNYHQFLSSSEIDEIVKSVGKYFISGIKNLSDLHDLL